MFQWFAGAWFLLFLVVNAYKPDMQPVWIVPDVLPNGQYGFPGETEKFLAVDCN